MPAVGSRPGGGHGSNWERHSHHAGPPPHRRPSPLPEEKEALSTSRGKHRKRAGVRKSWEEALPTPSQVCVCVCARARTDVCVCVCVCVCFARFYGHRHCVCVCMYTYRLVRQHMCSRTCLRRYVRASVVRTDAWGTRAPTLVRARARSLGNAHERFRTKQKHRFLASQIESCAPSRAQNLLASSRCISVSLSLSLSIYIYRNGAAE